MTSVGELVQRFQDITGVTDTDTAKFFLESSGWSVESATATFFETKGEIPKASAKPAQDVGIRDVPKPTRKGVVGFSDLSGDQPKKGQEYYTGGKSSGMMVQDPQAEGDLASRLLETAKKNAADSSFSTPPATNLKTRTLTFWKQGFTVDDGPLRLYDDPANKAFLEAVHRGVAPLELASQGEEIDTVLVDKKEENYKAPPPPPFSGAGCALGGGTSTTHTQISSKPSKSRPPFALDTSAPITSIQIRMHDGTRLVSKFNHQHTVGDLRDFVDRALPGKIQYQLQTTFPVKVLCDEEQTLADAGLLNAVIIQKPI